MRLGRGLAQVEQRLPGGLASGSAQRGDQAQLISSHPPTPSSSHRQAHVLRCRCAPISPCSPRPAHPLAPSAAPSAAYPWVAGRS